MSEGVPAEIEPLLDALAVIGRATPQRLAALLAAGADSSALPPPPDGAGVMQQGELWQMEAPAAARRLTSLEQRDVAAYRTLHQRALGMLAADLAGGEEAAEAWLVPLLWRLAERLLKDDPAALIALVREAASWPLQSAAAQQRRAYLEGAAWIKEGRYEAARRHLAALAAAPHIEPEVQARTLNAIAVCDRVGGRPEAARTGYLASLAIWQRLGDKLNEGKVRLNLGINAYALQQYDEAEQHLHEAAARLAEAGSLQWGAAVDNELGLLYRDRGDWAQARSHLDRFVAQRQREGATDAAGSGLNNIGEVLMLQGQLPAAQERFEAALAAMSTPTYRIDVRLNLGLIALAGGAHDGARQQFQAAGRRAAAIGREEIMPFVHLRQGQLFAAEGRMAEARRAFLQGAERIEQGRAPMAQERFRISLTGRWQQLYEHLILLEVAAGTPASALHWSERARARALTERLVDAEPAADGGALVALLQRHLDERSALLLYFTTGVEDMAIPMVRALDRGHPLRPHLLTPPHVLAFLLTRSRLTATICPLDPNLLSARGPRGSQIEPLLEPDVRRTLYERLLAPLNLPDGLDRLYLAPHGPLHRLPFGALLDAEDRPLLREEGPDLIYVPGARYLAARLADRRPAAASGRMLAIGYNGSARAAPLTHAEEEAQEVARMMGGEALVGPLAAAAARPESVAGRQRLHLACHGWFDEAQPLSSYLEIGPGQRLTGEEILQAWRLEAELVTLSACQTGVSHLLRGDEPMGLIRALLSAGAARVVVSGWRVDDQATRRLMRAFYRRLAQGEAAPTALRHAQIHLRTREESDGTRPHAAARDWAAFRIVGLARGGELHDELQLREEGARHIRE